jgi:hypothetical protein
MSKITRITEEFNWDNMGDRIRKVRGKLLEKFPEHTEEINKMSVTTAENNQLKIPKSRISPELYVKIESDEGLRGLLLPLQ